MNIKLKELKNIQSENCITIILNTHRTFPDSQQDEILVKNLVKEAENRLLTNYSKKEIQVLLDRMNTLVDSIDHRMNLESLILFINEDISEYTRLAIPVENRVIIDTTFATRDLVRAIHNQANYYVLVLNKDEARLIEASNNKVIEEFGFPFPFKNKLSQTTNTIEPSDSGRQRNLNAEFFNQVDKVVNETRKNNSLPVLICTEENNFHNYLKIADQPNTIYDIFLSRSRQVEKAHAIVSDAWEIIKTYTTERNNERKSELQKAVSQNKFLSDTNDIFRSIKEGRIQTLFIEEGLFQSALIENEQIKYVSENQKTDTNVIDDIYDELIELNMDYGGEVVFLPQGELQKFNGFGAITRY